MSEKSKIFFGYIIGVIFIVGSYLVIDLVLSLRGYGLVFKDYIWFVAGSFSVLWLVILGFKKELTSKHSLLFFLLPSFILFPIPFIGGHYGLFTPDEVFSWSVIFLCSQLSTLSILGFVFRAFKRS